MAAPDLVKEFENWWQNEEILNIDFRSGSRGGGTFFKQWNYKGIADKDTICKGTYCNVFKDYYQQDGKKCAVKYTNGNREEMLELYFEYKTHLALWNLYKNNNMVPRVIEPLWIKKICLNRGFHCPPVAIGFERFDQTMWEYLMEHKGDTDDSRRWKKEMITELKRAHKVWEFSHRDCHLMNIAVVNNDWRLFDLGMSKVSGYEPYQGASAFMHITNTPVPNMMREFSDSHGMLLVMKMNGYITNKKNWHVHRRLYGKRIAL